MFGAVIGDVTGSVYEWDLIKTQDFPLFSPPATSPTTPFSPSQPPATPAATRTSADATPAAAAAPASFTGSPARTTPPLGKSQKPCR